MSIFKYSIELFALPHSQWSSIYPFPGPLLFSVIQTNPIVLLNGFRDEFLVKEIKPLILLYNKYYFVTRAVSQLKFFI